MEHTDLMESALVYNSIIPKMEICQRNLIVIQLDQGLHSAVCSIQSCQILCFLSKTHTKCDLCKTREKPFKRWTAKLAIDVAIIHILSNHFHKTGSCSIIYVTMKIYYTLSYHIPYLAQLWYPEIKGCNSWLVEMRAVVTSLNG